MSLQRPLPPVELFETESAVPVFLPAPDLEAWLRDTFVAEDGPLHNPEHMHLQVASIGVLWTNAKNTRNGRRVVGQAEHRPPGGSMGKWARARAAAQLWGWFGRQLDFLLTFDAHFARDCSDAAFCALVEHELMHCGQANDEYGMPRFSEESGTPIFCLRGHDVEEFVSIVRRYGAQAARVDELVEAALEGPTVALAAIGAACGTCS